MNYAYLLLTAVSVLFVSCSRSDITVIDKVPLNMEFSIRQDVLEIAQVNFDSALYTDAPGYPKIDFKKLENLRQKEIVKKYNSVILKMTL